MLSQHLIEHRTLADIGRELGIGGDRVRQLEARALEKLWLLPEEDRRGYLQGLRSKLQAT